MTGWLERLLAKLPWYDPDVVARRQAHTEAVRQRSIDARIATERLPAVRELRRLEASAARGTRRR